VIFDILIPLCYSKVEYPLAPEDVKERLRRRIKFGSHLFFWGAGRVSAGDLWGKWNQDGSFSVMRSISYQNTYLPVCRGRIQAAGGGSEISLRFWAPYSFFMLAGFVAMSYLVRAKGTREQAFLLLFMACAAHAVSIALFFWEKRKIERKLDEILRGQSISQ
jgi:hypothetical protein